MENKFVGMSDVGDFNEALQLAIQTAKDKLKTDFVKWKIESMFGENGGFVLVNKLNVEISVSIA